MRGPRGRHGLYATPEYWIWAAMLQRCHNPRHRSFARYGGRGIVVCDSWRESFQEFIDHIGRRPSAAHSIDRIDNARGYEPGNVRWATAAQQLYNTRRTLLVTIDGWTRPAREWAREHGIPGPAMENRLRRGWDPIRAVTAPLTFERNPNRKKK